MTDAAEVSSEVARPPVRARRAPLLLACVLAGALLATFVALDDPGARAFNPEAAGAASRDGDRLLAAADFAGAVEAYTKAIGHDQSSAQPFFGRALARSQMGDLRGAARDLRTALILEPDFSDARVARAGIRVEAGDLEGALADIRTALREEPDSWQLHLQLGGLMSLTGDLDATAAEYGLAADLLEGRGQKTLADATRQLLDDTRVPSQTKAPDIPDVITAERALVAFYVEKPDYADLLDSAWSAAVDIVRRAGVAVPASLEPRLGVSQTAAESNTQAAFGSLVRLAGGAVSRDDIVFEAIEAMARSLEDNHTGFIRPVLWQQRQPGASFGVGIYWVEYEGGGALVREVIPGSPGAKAGIRPGDVISSSDAIDEAAEDFSRLGTGARTVTVERRSSRFQVEIAPASYPTPHISSRMLEGHIGYVRITSFPLHLERTSDDKTFIRVLESSITDLKRQGASRWVLDLRGNPGGSAVTGSLVAARFGLKGLLTEFHARSDRISINSALGPNLIGGQPLAVLVDGHSASMAEALAEAFKDAGRGRVFGSVSAGKVNGASVQPVAGGGLEITLARIRSGPLKVDVDGVGVQPDEAVALDRDGLAGGSDSQLAAAVRYLLSRRGR